MRQIGFYILCIISLVQAQSPYLPTEENLKAREAFQDDKFGLFIHWGVYSLLGDGEWVMQNQDISIDRYAKLPTFFNPIDFDAKEWVSMVKSAGMKYITITTKHHDGFAMYDSEVSDYNIVDATPFGRDIFRELEQECIRQGIKLYAYYSQLDRRHPDYFPRGWTGRRTGRPESGNWEKYLQFQDAQIKEIAENYKISGFWFDGWWDHRWDEQSWWRAVKYRLPKDQIDWKLRRTYDMIHEVNSALLIGNNHHIKPFDGEDFQMFEKDLPGFNTTGFGSTKDDIGALPLETAQTINHSWGFNLQDGENKSIEDLIQFLIKSAGYGANLLLNVGPMPNGAIQEDHKALLLKMGKWLQENGETIYGSRQGPIPPQTWGVSTQKNDDIYIHILYPINGTIFIPDLKMDQIDEMTFWKSGNEVTFANFHEGMMLGIPEKEQSQYDTIIKLKLKK